MAQTYRFQISMPVTSILPRDRVINVVHLEHVTGGVLATDLDGMCQDICEMYQARYHQASAEVECKCYDLSPPPNLPLGQARVNAGVPWTTIYPRETALCLSFAGDNRGDKRGRGRIYLMPQIDPTVGATATRERPSTTAMNWALDFFRSPNASFPDLGGVDWKFGIWSRVGQKFTQAQQAWVDDEWDAQRRRGLRETTRVTSTREG